MRYRSDLLKVHRLEVKLEMNPGRQAFAGGAGDWSPDGRLKLRSCLYPRKGG